MKGAKPKLDNVIPMMGAAAPVVVLPPDHMSEHAQNVWAELAPELAKLGRLDPVYRYEFAGYCESVANFIAATILLHDHGMWREVQTRNGLQQKKTMAFSLQQEAMASMRQGAARFGLTPVDACRLATGGQGDLFDQIARTLNEPD